MAFGPEGIAGFIEEVGERFEHIESSRELETEERHADCHRALAAKAPGVGVRDVTKAVGACPDKLSRSRRGHAAVEHT